MRLRRTISTALLGLATLPGLAGLAGQPALAASGVPAATAEPEAAQIALPPGAILSARSQADRAKARIATGAFANGALPGIEAEGAVSQEAWRLPATRATTYDIISDLRGQLERAGYEILFECETDACGGFDFRYALDLLPEPDMHVDLGDFRYLAARAARAGAPGSDSVPRLVALVVSRAGQAGFVQITRIGAPRAMPAETVASSRSPRAGLEATPDARADDLGSRLIAEGHVALDDLSFAPGSAELTGDSPRSLAALAAWLRDNPDRTIALVGHTDATGSLEANIALSRKRALAVMRRLVHDFGVPSERIEAAGVGYLVPRASNLTAEGRQKNRRVEAILTSTR